MVIYKSIETLFDDFAIKDHASLSFHHHLRNGDAVMNLVLNTCIKRNLTHMNLYPSGIFPVHTALFKMIQSNRVTHLKTNYLNGSVYDAINTYGVKGDFTMQSHGGRARAIIEKETSIDYAFIAVSAADLKGNATGLEGKNILGSLGYAMEDLTHAKTVILVTDTLKETLETPQISHEFVDAILEVDSIGDSKGIVSGTLEITNDPLGLKIARETMRVLKTSGLIKDNVSFQSGAGGISLAITKMFNEYLKTHHLKAAFYTGGITAHHVKALNDGLVSFLYDVQCFDLEAIKSLKENPAHKYMSASDYANPNNLARKIGDLDIVILGATEVDLGYNVNVTTDSLGRIIGGSGGHSDTSEDATLTIIVSPLLKGRMPLIKDKVNTITTEGKHVDIIVTERGIAINPNRKDLIQKLSQANLPLMSIESLQAKAHALSGIPKPLARSSAIIGSIENRHGTCIDQLYQRSDV